MVINGRFIVLKDDGIRKYQCVYPYWNIIFIIRNANGDDSCTLAAQDTFNHFNVAHNLEVCCWRDIISSPVAEYTNMAIFEQLTYTLPVEEGFFQINRSSYAQTYVFV